MANRSIKNNLIFSLSILISITLLAIAFFAYSVARHEASRIFDSSLVRTAKLLLSLTKHEIIEHDTGDNFTIDLGLADERYFHRYENKIHFQIWKKNNLIYNSSADINDQKPQDEGFRGVVLDGQGWRVFVIYDAASELTIEVMESKDVRQKLIQKILLIILLPVSIAFIPIIFIIWFVVNRGLFKLTLLSAKIRRISPLHLKPFAKSENLPDEIKPLIDSLNFLMIRLEDSMDKERKFINYASHELRTPLAIIKTKTQFLTKKYQNNAAITEDLSNMLLAVDRIINLSNQLLILSRIDTENNDIEKKEINVGELITKVTSDFAAIARKKNITLHLEVDSQCIIEGNSFHLEILFNNLLDNAIKYSPANEVVHIRLRKEDNRIAFCIDNKGQHISPNQQDRIFERFYRIEREVNGSGLGLSIVKKISDLYHLNVMFSSENGINRFEIWF